MFPEKLLKKKCAFRIMNILVHAGVFHILIFKMRLVDGWMDGWMDR
jgi:hypothetical protein